MSAETLSERVRECWGDDLTVTEQEMARRIIRAAADWFEQMDTDPLVGVWSAPRWAARVLRSEADDGDQMAIRA